MEQPDHENRDSEDHPVSIDATQFGELYNQYAPEVFVFLRNRLPELHDAEDVCQIVWTKAWGNLSRFDGSHFRGWIFKIANHALTDRFRKNKRNKTNSLIESDELGLVTEEDLKPERAEVWQHLEDCLETLGPRLFEVITRVKRDEESASDVARDLGTSTNQIYKAVHKARTQLKQCVEMKSQ